MSDEDAKWAEIYAALAPTAQTPRKPAAEAIDMSRKARSARSKAASRAADGRTARATGRTEIFHFRCRPDLPALIRKAAKQEAGGNVAAWLEGLIDAATKEKG